MELKIDAAKIGTNLEHSKLFSNKITAIKKL